jgi:putative flippase GtrA
MGALVKLEEVPERCDSDAAPAVDGVSLQIAPGEAGAVMGLSGPRKPALLNMITGLPRPARVCVPVPTRNEAGNVGPLVARLGPVLAGLGGEVPVVGDSDDHTPAAVGAAASAAAVPVRLRLAVAGRAGRLVRFAVVGGTGVMVNLAVLALLLRVTPSAFGAGAGGQIVSAVAATQVAVGWNFALTERWVFPGRPGHWAARLLLFWVLNCGALLAQLPLAARLRPVLGGSYVLATGAALAILMLARFTVCDRWLYRPAGRERAPARLAAAPRGELPTDLSQGGQQS